MKTDVVVVGAGPAGSSAAKFASKKGLDVLVLERKEEAGQKSPCAGYVSKLVARYFKVDRKFIQQEVHTMKTYLPSGAFQLAGMNGWIVDRPKFDKSLAAQAVDSGSELILGARAEGLLKKDGRIRGVLYRKDGKKREVRCKVVVGADGVFSRVAKWSGLPTQSRENIAICHQHEMDSVELEDPSITETYFGVDYAPGAYAWIYPTGKNSAKVGLGIKKSLAKLRPAQYLERFIHEHPIASKKLKNSSIESTITGLVPIGGALKTTYSCGVLLVGDAAAMTDAISGAGILSGILAGKLAAGVINDAIAENDTSKERLRDYEKRWKKVLEKRLVRSLSKRKTVNKAYSSDMELEQVLPKTWITFKEFWTSH